MSFDKFKKEYIPLVKNFDCGNVVINNFLIVKMPWILIRALLMFCYQMIKILL